MPTVAKVDPAERRRNSFAVQSACRWPVGTRPADRAMSMVRKCRRRMPMAEVVWACSWVPSVRVRESLKICAYVLYDSG